jgi:hypothetical protein
MTLYPAAAAVIPWQGGPVYVGNQPTYIVIHVGQGWMRTWDGWADDAAYDGKSFHFGVGLNGDIHQYLEEHQGGAHCGGSTATLHPVLQPHTANVMTIGIEHEGFLDAQSPSGFVVNQWNFYQILASAKLVRWLCGLLSIPKTREFIIGHYEISTDRANDPGPLFPWDEYMRLITEEEDSMTPDEKARLERLERIVAANGAVVDGVLTSGQDAIIGLDALGVSLALQGFDQNAAILADRARYDAHLEEHELAGNEGFGIHTHVTGGFGIHTHVTGGPQP